jgi:hypothetical protein
LPEDFDRLERAVLPGFAVFSLVFAQNEQQMGLLDADFPGST